jgi:hypothetical protein
MLYGHIGVGFAAKRVAPKASLGALLLASTALDTLCGIFLLTGIERTDPNGVSHMPWSHGLLIAVIWSLVSLGLVGLGLAYLVSRDRRTSVLIGLLVFSHWVLDFASHPMGMGRELPPDLPLLFGGAPRVGLGLCNSIPAAIVTDFGLLIGGIIIYLVSTKPRDRMGVWAFWATVLFIVALALPGAVPESAVLATLAQPLLLPLGIWVERHRSTRTARGRT